jgi:hypothetical protein
MCQEIVPCIGNIWAQEFVFAKIEGQRQRAQHLTMASTSSSCVDNVSKALMTWLKTV